MEAVVETIFLGDEYKKQQVDRLLESVNLKIDRNLDYICGIFNEQGKLIATGGCFKNTIRCIAIEKEYQGRGILNKIISHLIEIQAERGNTHIFLYTMKKNERIFQSCGFYKIVSTDDNLIFMENKKNGFQKYCADLREKRVKGDLIGSIVMKCNPFTLGHQYLIEKASSENDIVHIFIIGENFGSIPFSTRKKLIYESVAHLSNIIIHDTESYLISASTFPSYFFPDEDSMIKAQAKLDLNIFHQIAKALFINKRYFGEEKRSYATSIYNDIMKKNLPLKGITYEEVNRIMDGGAYHQC